MMELSHRNHFQYGYNNTPFNFRKTIEDEWFVHYGRCEALPENFGRQCLNTAKTIGSKTKLPIQVMFSGGIDSEVTLRSFVGAKVPVEAAILKFKHDLNIHDISWAVVTCEELGVPYKFYELDVLRFWEGEAIDFADRTYCVSPQLLSTMWLIDQLDGYPVMGSGECLLIRQDAPEPEVEPPKKYGENEWELWEKEKIASWYRHFMVRGRDGCPGFFQYTPEIMLAYLWDPLIWDMCQNHLYGKYSTISMKYITYQRHFKNLKSRQKYTGFERVADQELRLRDHLMKKYPACDAIAKTTVQKLVKSLAPVVGNPGRIVTSVR